MMRPWNVAKTVGNGLFERVGRIAGRVHEHRSLAADVLESDEEYLIVFDAPGASQSDVQVRYLDGEVLVRIDRFRDYYEGFEMRFPGRGLSLDGRVTLPEDVEVNTETASATLTANGSLHIRLQKEQLDDSPPATDTDTVEQIDIDGGET